MNKDSSSNPNNDNNDNVNNYPSSPLNHTLNSYCNDPACAECLQRYYKHYDYLIKTNNLQYTQQYTSPYTTQIPQRTNSQYINFSK